MSDLLKRLESIKKQFNGATTVGGTLEMADEFGRPEILPTGFPELDNKVLVIGGIPKGRVIELAGETGAGKSTLSVNIMAKAIAGGLTCIYADKEDTMDYEYGEKIGCPRDSYLIYKGYGQSGPEFLENTLALIETGVDLLILDSLSFIASDDVSNTNLSEANMKTSMGTPVLTKLWIQKLYSGWAPKTEKNKGKSVTTIMECGTTLIVIEHLKEKIGPTYGKPQKDSGGGESKKFAYSMRIFLEKYGYVREKSQLDADGNPIYSKTRITCEKSKLGPGGRSTIMFVDSRDGKFYSDSEALVRFAKDMKVFEQKGGWYYWHPEFKVDEELRTKLGVSDMGMDQKYQGKDLVLEVINSHPPLLNYLLGVKEKEQV